jgi:DHA1 family inner membrane transport protein
MGTAEIALTGLLPDVAAGLGVSLPSVGLLVTAYALGVAFCGPAVTLATIRISPKPLLIGLMALFVVGNTGSCLADGYATLLASRVFTSLTHGTFVAAAGLVAVNVSPPGREASAIARVSLGFTVANLLGAPLGTIIGQHWGWRASFGSIAAVSLLSTLLLLAFLPSTGRGGRGGSDGGGSRTPQTHGVPRGGARLSVGTLREELQVMRRAVVLVSMAVTVLAQGAVFTVSTYLAPLVREVSHMPASTIGPLFAVYGAGAVLGTVLGGRAADRDPTAGTVRSLTALVAALALLWLLAPVRLLMPLGLFLFGAAGFSIIPVLQARVLYLASAAPLLSLSANVSAFNLGNGSGAWLGGAAIDLGGGARSVTIAASVAAAAALALVLPAWLPTRRGHQRREPDITRHVTVLTSPEDTDAIRSR